MKHEQTNNTVCVELNTHELWYVAKLFAPGLIFGVEDPTEGLSEAEILSYDNQAYASLEKAGMISTSNTGMLVIDEMLGAMVFSCIKSDDVLITTNKNINQKSFYFFLPNWQLELKKVNDVYKLTHFSDREVLLSTIIENVKLKSNHIEQKQEFFIYERQLELATFLYDSGKKDKSLITLEEKLIGEIPDKNEFIQGYVKSISHHIFELIIARNDEESMSQERYEILQSDKHLYWLTQMANEENGEKIIYFQETSSNEIKKILDYVVP